MIKDYFAAYEQQYPEQQSQLRKISLALHRNGVSTMSELVRLYMQNPEQLFADAFHRRKELRADRSSVQAVSDYGTIGGNPMRTKWKRPLAVVLLAALIFSMNSAPVYAVELGEGTTATSQVDQADGVQEQCSCTTLCTESSKNPDCPVCGAEGADLTACAGTVEEGDAAEQAVTAWEWIGADNLNEGVLPLTGVGEANPVDFDTVVSLLPTGITATGDGSEEPVELVLTWSCEGFPEQAAEGEYTFTAELPQGYALGEETAALTVPVILGGGTTLDGDGQPDGEGTEESPYQISTVDELLWFAGLVNGTLMTDGTEQNAAACAVLTADIDLTGADWTPIGTDTNNYFKGTFDGGDHTISNLTIDTNASYVGLFGATSGATLKNVTLDNPKVQNSATGTSNTGALVGYMVGNGTVEYCAVTNGSVSSDDQRVGGLIGYIYAGTVRYCYNLETEVRSSYSTTDYVNGVAGETRNYSYLCSSFSYVSNQKELKASNTAKYAAYLSETPTERTGTYGDQHGFTAEQFQDGTVAYFLRTGFYSNVSYEGWGQTLGADKLPEWNSEVVESLKYTHLGDTGAAVDAYAYFNALTPDDDDTYHIEDTSDWIAFVKLVKEDMNYSANAVVTEGAVIDFSQFGTLTNKSTYSYLVIADYFSDEPYTGTFIGNGCTVKGVSYSGTMEFALFGTIGEGGSVSGITLETPEITGTTTGAYNIAGIASHNYGIIDDCHVDGGTISTVATTAAGIAAESFGTVSNCTNSADITAKYEVAGIVATSNSTNGNTSSTKLMKIKGCSNSGTITATYAGSSHAGGIFGGQYQFSNRGYPYGTISKCFNTGNILGQSYIGGIVGYSIKNANASAANVTIENCYNTGAIGDDRTTGVAGGISAGAYSSVSNCFNMGDVTGTYAQPIVANGQNTQAWSVNSYASCEVTGKSTTLYYGEDDDNQSGSTDEQGRYCRGNGKRTDAEMASGEVAYLLNGSTSADGLVWYQNLDNGETVDKYPVLDSSHGVVYAQRNCMDGLSGVYGNSEFTENVHIFDENGFCTECGQYEPAVWNEENNRYEISNAGQLFWFAALVNGDNTHADFDSQDTAVSAVLMNDIDLNKVRWTPIGTSSTPYIGTFDGQNHTISGLYVYNSRSDYQGFVGYLGKAGTIQNLTLGEGCSVTGSSGVGGVCGYNGGAITGCTNNGAVEGYSYLGGICGYNYGTVRNCTNSGTVAGMVSGVGGICGYNSNIITNCHNSGTVKGTIASASNVGGVCGSGNTGCTISYCWNSGTISNKGDTVGGVCGYSSPNQTIQSCYSTGIVTGGSKVGGICGYKSNFVSFQNCYWLDTSASMGCGTNSGTVSGAESKTAEEFASGEVAYLLNGSSSENPAWYQNLDNGQTVDSYPVLDSSHGIVYRIEANPVFYSNDPNSQPPVIVSVDITWGELSFTYSDGTWNPDTHEYDGEGWTVDNEGGNSIKVENTGNTDVNVTYEYKAEETGITGSFTDGENPVSAPVSLPENDSSTVYLILAGKPEKEWEKAPIGAVTVTIGGESE